MLTLITSCNRHDLLARTINSLVKDQKHSLDIVINEDSDIVSVPYIPNAMINAYKAGGKGQHASIEMFIEASKNKAKYYLHCEDDWEFENSYDWIDESIKIMESDPKIIKVMCRADGVHPCEFKNGYGIFEPWVDPWKSYLWHGFGWNPGVTRLDLLNKFIPFGKTEQEVSEAIYKAGYRVALLEKGVCKHIGGYRSTHE